MELLKSKTVSFSVSVNALTEPLRAPIGDEYAAQDLEFAVANKVSFIVNCAGK